MSKIRIIEIEINEPIIEKSLEELLKQPVNKLDYNPCINCPNNKPDQFNACHCTLPYMYRTIC